MSEVTQTIDQVIKLELAKFDPFEKRIIELREKYKGLTIADINDKEGYENVRVAIGELRSIRTGTEKDKKVIKKPLWDACTTIEEKSKWIISEVSKIEDPMQARKDEIDAEKEKIKQEKKQAQERTFIQRSMQLSNMGVLFDGVNFILEEASYEGVLVREADEEVYNEFILPKFKVIFDRNEAIRLEELRVKKEQEDKEKTEREEFAKQQAELKKQQDELDRKNKEAEQKENLRLEKEKKEKEDAIQKLFSDRLQKLDEVKYNGVQVMYDGKLLRNRSEIIEMTDDDFEKFSTFHNNTVAIARELADQKRIESLKEKARIELEEENKQAEIKKQQENQRKEEELAKAGDKTKWEDYISKIAAIKQPSFRSGQYRKVALTAQQKIDEVVKLKA